MFSARKDNKKNRVSDRVFGIKCGVMDSHCVTNLALIVRAGVITQSRANPWSFVYFNSVILVGGTSQSLLWTSMTQLFKSSVKSGSFLGVKR